MSAVEHYEAKEQMNKFQYFQSQLNELMTDEKVQLALARDYEHEEQAKILETQDTEEKKKLLHKKMNRKLKENQQKKDPSYTSNLIIKRQDKVESMDELIQGNLDFQRREIRLKIAKRRLQLKKRNQDIAKSYGALSQISEGSNPELANLTQEEKKALMTLNIPKSNPKGGAEGSKSARGTKSKKNNFFSKLKKKDKKNRKSKKDKRKKEKVKIEITPSRISEADDERGSSMVKTGDVSQAVEDGKVISEFITVEENQNEDQDFEGMTQEEIDEIKKLEQELEDQMKADELALQQELEEQLEKQLAEEEEAMMEELRKLEEAELENSQAEEEKPIEKQGISISVTQAEEPVMSQEELDMINELEKTEKKPKKKKSKSLTLNFEVKTYP